MAEEDWLPVAGTFCLAFVFLLPPLSACLRTALSIRLIVFFPSESFSEAWIPICLRLPGEGHTHLLRSGLTALLWLAQGQGTRYSQNKGHLSWNGPSTLGWEEFTQAKRQGGGGGSKPLHCVAQPLYFVSRMEKTHYFRWLLGFPYLLLVCYHSGEGKGEKTTPSSIWNLKDEYVRFTLPQWCSFSKVQDHGMSSLEALEKFKQYCPIFYTTKL